MKFYPAELPLPLQSGYTSQHRPNMIRTQMADGYTRQRLINQGAPDTVQAQLIIDESHCVLYQEVVPLGCEPLGR